MLKAVLWDLDGTLVDSEPAHGEAFEAALGELGLQVGQAFHDACLGASEDAVHTALVAETGTAVGLDAWRALKWGHYSALAARIETRTEVAVIARRLAARGVPMAVVSNSTRDEVVLNLAATGLAPLFPVTISRHEVARGKPDPEGYLAAAARLGVAPEACLVVEDSPAGTRAGLAAGMTTIFHPQDPALPVVPGALTVGPDGLAALLQRLGFPIPPAEGDERCAPPA